MVLGILYIVYWISLVSSGYLLYVFLFKDTVVSIFSHAASLLLGMTVGVSLTYLLSVLLHAVGFPEPMVTGVLLYSIGVFLVFYARRSILKSIHIPQVTVTDLIVLISSLSLSVYIMIKTFKYASGTFLLERNVLFDFAHLLSIVRSLSLGANIPYQSPFVSGTDHVYHFLFAFFAAIGERLSIPIQWAVNIPSIIGFWVFLLLMYGFIVYIQKLPKFVGLIGVVFLCFQSSFTFFHWITQQQITLSSLWRFPNYLFAGPFDNSVISIFVTLNTYVNQRHLSFALGYMILFLSYVHLHKNHTHAKIFLVGLISGLLVPWHITIVPFVTLIGAFQLFLAKKFIHGLLLIGGLLLGFLPYVILWFPTLYRIVFSIGDVSIHALPPATVLPIPAVQFFIQNFGLLLLFIAIGLIWGKKYMGMFILPLIISFVVVVWQFRLGIVDQKVFSILLVIMKLTAVVGIYKLSLMKWGKGIVFILVFITVLSGVLDLLVIKNDYVYKVADWSNNKVMQWIKEETPNNAVILSYQEMFDPVILAGRKQYFGFFKQPQQMWPDTIKERDQEVKNIYESTDVTGFAKSQLDYIVLPKTSRTDFYFDVTNLLNSTMYPTEYEDEEVRIISVGKML